MSDATTPDAVLAFWFDGDRETFRERWFRPDAAFDAAIRERLGALVAPAAAGAFDPWAATPEGALALCLLLDQFPRNLHRGTAQAYACDPKAREIARAAVLRDRHDLRLTATERIFLYLPFEHSEDMSDQDLSVALFEGLRDHPAHRGPGGTIDYAWRHWLVIREFGRFPHRNAALRRISTVAKKAYLARHGAGF
jgi:uncharacterized protein (DUF924 family)